MRLPNETPVSSTGILLMVAATLCSASMNTAAQHLSDNIHPFEIVFFRNFFAFLFVLPLMSRHGFTIFQTRRLKGHFARAALNVINMLVFFYALSITPLSELVALSFTAPIFATLLGVFIFKETVGVRRWIAIFFAFGGTIIVTQPGFDHFSFGQSLTLIAAFMWAGVLLIIKSLSQSETSSTIVAYMVVLMTPMSLIPALSIWQWPTANELMWLAFMGITGGGGQFLIAQALRNADLKTIMPFDFMKLVWISIIMFVIFDKIPALRTWIGGALIFFSGAYIAYREQILKRKN